MQEVQGLLTNPISLFWERGWLLDPGSLLSCVSLHDAIQYLHSIPESILLRAFFFSSGIWG